MTEAAASPTPPAPPAPPPRRSHPLRNLLLGWTGYLLSLAAGLALVLGAAWWLLFTEPGTTWLLARVPMLQVSGVRGALFGDFERTRFK